MFAAVASLVLGYGIRDCGEETKPEEPDPIVETVSQDDDDSLQKRFEGVSAQLEKQRKETRQYKANAEELSSQLSDERATSEKLRQENELFKKSTPEQIASLQTKLTKLEILLIKI
jgi:predicted RNase H-like nuclease (RuvC/YqgF family)